MIVGCAHVPYYLVVKYRRCPVCKAKKGDPCTDLRDQDFPVASRLAIAVPHKARRDMFQRGAETRS